MEKSFKPVIDYQHEAFADAIPVYEFGRLAQYLLEGLVAALQKQGFSEAHAIEIVQSRWLRKSLDHHEEFFRMMTQGVADNFVRSQEHLKRDVTRYLGDGVS